MAPHPYSASIGSWLWLTEPIWYGFGQSFSRLEPSDPEYCGILQAGNPVYFWGGLLALVVCGVRSVFRRSRQGRSRAGRDRLGLGILAFYFGSLLVWALIPRKMHYHYYYYPSSFLLAFAWVHWLRGLQPGWKYRLAAALMAAQGALFWFLLPISNGSCLTPREFERRLILEEWKPVELRRC